METIFELKNVNYSYLKKVEALKDINLQINQGEQACILGSNGSGKSTLLAILDGLIYPTSGESYAFGQQITEDAFESIGDNEFRSYFRDRVGFVFQNSDVQLFSPTVFDEIAFGPLQLNMPKEDAKARAEELMEMVGITRLRDRAPHTLSGGEKKKVCIASVLAINPSVLLLDEPTAGLDPRTQLWLIELLQELADAGKTIVTATHDLETVDKISRRAIVMGEDHRIRMDADVNKVLEDFDLLLEANLIHEHMHRHGTVVHRHVHDHETEHRHVHLDRV